MPNWNDVLKEIDGARPPSPIDSIRRKYLKELSDHTGRNTIAYYSGWLKGAKNAPSLYVNDEDKNAFMTTIHELDKTKGLDLLLHTPGGDIAATESLVDYLRKIFGTDIRAIVPQLAMSAGTMIACSCKVIIMGKESNLGPIDPQINGFPATGVIAEFKKAIAEVTENPNSLPLWQTIIGKYHPTFIGSCEHAIQWSGQIVRGWLETGMFSGQTDAKEKAVRVVEGLTTPDKTFSHARHIHLETLEDMGLVIEKLENDQTLQDLVLTTHHAFMHSLSLTPAIKIVENQNGVAYVRIGE